MNNIVQLNKYRQKLFRKQLVSMSKNDMVVLMRDFYKQDLDTITDLEKLENGIAIYTVFLNRFQIAETYSIILKAYLKRITERYQALTLTHKNDTIH